MDLLESAKLNLEHAREFEALDRNSLEFERETRKLAREQQQLIVNEYIAQVDQLELRSPFRGTIGSLLIERQAWVQPGTPVMTVIDLTNFELEGSVPQSYADDLVPGISAEIRVGLETFPGVLISVSQEVINNSVPVRIDFGSQIPGDLRVNQQLTTRLLLDTRENVNILSRGPFLESGGGRIAYVVQNDLAIRQDIEVGATSINEVEILSGLDPGDEVIISNINIFDGANTVYIGR